MSSSQKDTTKMTEQAAIVRSAKSLIELTLSNCLVAEKTGGDVEESEGRSGSKPPSDPPAFGAAGLSVLSLPRSFGLPLA
jgi:hypothetical protein